MAIKIGVLQVDLVAGTASFTGPLDKAGQQAKKTGKDIQGAFDGIDTREARGSIMLLGEEIGLHLPRHVQAFIAELPGVATAVAAAFPVLAVIAIGKAVFEFSEHVKKAKEELEKAKQASLDNVDALAKHALQLELNNMKLADQIGMLQGRPTRNKLAEALLEAKVQAIDLTKELQKANAEAIKSLEELSVGGFKSAFTGEENTNEHTEKAKENLKAMSADMQAWNNAVQAGAPSKALKDKLDADIANLKKFANDWKSETDKIVLSNSRTFLQKQAGEEPNPIFKVAEEAKHEKARAAQQELLGMVQQFQNLLTASEQEESKKRQAASLEELHSRVENLDKQFAASKKVLDEETAVSIAASEAQFLQGKITAAQLADAKQASLDRQFAAERSHLEQVRALEQGQPALVDQVNKEILALDLKHQAEVLKAWDETLKTRKSELETFTKFIEAEDVKQTASAAKAAEEQLKIIERKNKSRIDLIRMLQQPGITAEAINSYLAGAAAMKKFDDEQQRAQALSKFRQENPGLSEEDFAKADAAIRAQIDLQTQLAAAQKVAAENHITAINAEIAALEKLRLKAIQNGQSTRAIDALLHKDELQRLTDMATELIQTNKLGSVFKGIMLQMAIEGKTSAQQIGLAFKNSVGGLNSNLAQLAVTGKADFRGLASSAIQDFIKIALQWVESHTIMAAMGNLFSDQESSQAAELAAAKIASNVLIAQSSAATAAANTLAEAPWPINISQSAIVFALGEVYAADAAASRGAVLPNREMLVHTHPEEMILPRNLSTFIQGAFSQSSGDRGGGDTHFSPVFSPRISAIDAAGVDRMLTKHADIFQRHMEQAMRRWHMKVH